MKGRQAAALALCSCANGFVMLVPRTATAMRQTTRMMSEGQRPIANETFPKASSPMPSANESYPPSKTEDNTAAPSKAVTTASSSSSTSSSSTSSSPKDTSSTDTSSALVPVNPANVEFGAGLVGGITGLLVGGPLVGLIFSLAANYGSKQENDVGDAVRGLSKTAIEAINFLTKLNAKYDVTGQAGNALGDVVGKIKQNDDSNAIEKVEESIAKAKQLASEYDLAAKTKQALGVVGELADTAIVKTVELEKEYNVVDKVKTQVQKAVNSSGEPLI